MPLDELLDANTSPTPRWGPEWIELPGGTALLRRDLRPCGGLVHLDRPCGNVLFELVDTPWFEPRLGRKADDEQKVEVGPRRLSVRCTRCHPVRSFERSLGTLDMATGRLDLFAGPEARR